MAPGYVVAILLEAAGSLGLIWALILIRRERLSNAAGLRGYFGTADGNRGRRPAQPIVSVSVPSARTATAGDGEANARLALRRALLAA